MKPSALGLDGWSLADLRSLPDRLPGWLADLLREVERLGKWPTRLAEGYTALIPKEGPPGPLNTRPLIVLSMVYRLWAGVRLVDAIAWQEASAHPAAFGFRPARSALDGAAVTQVLLELCRLRGWAVAGMSIDYVQCFDLIHKAVVLALALELGMDPGTCRALGAMYKQLRRAFKIAGGFGLWWQATNGILKGCPPFGDPGECAHHDLEMGGGLPAPSSMRTNGHPPAGSGRGRGGRPGTGGPAPPQGCRPRLRRGGVVRLRGRHPGGGPGRGRAPGHGPRNGGMATDHGAGRPRGQVLLLGPGEQGAPAVLLRGVPIPLATTFRQLGVGVAIGGSKATGPVLSRRLEAGGSALRRLPHLSTYDRRERAVSTLVTPLALHGVAVASVTEPDLRGLETAVVRALWGPARVSRAKEVIFTVLSKGHRVSPIMHTRYERLLWLARLARRPGVTQVFAHAIWESGAAHLGRARWGARSARRPPWAGPRTRAGGAGTSRGTSTPCTSCRSRSASSSTESETAYAATPRASWRRDAPSPSGGWATGRMARPAAQRCGQPPRSWRSRCCAGSWLEPCGRRPGCRATACAPTPRARTAARRTRTRPTSCGTAWSGATPEGRGSPG